MCSWNPCDIGLDKCWFGWGGKGVGSSLLKMCGSFSFGVCMERELSVYLEFLLWNFEEKNILLLWFQNDMAHSIWSLCMISTSIWVKLCFLYRNIRDHILKNCRNLYITFLFIKFKWSVVVSALYGALQSLIWCGEERVMAFKTRKC